MLFQNSFLCVSAPLIFISFLFQRRGNEKQAIAFLLAGAACLRFSVALDPYLHEWDERFHALVAKHVMNHPLVPTLYDHPLFPFDYKGWNVNSIWLHKPPLTLWVMALSMKIFGVNEIAIRIPALLFSTVAVFLTWFIAKRLFNQHVAWLAAFFQSINGFVIEISGGRIATDHVDVFFFFFIELAVAFAILQKEKRNKIFLVLFSLSLACAIYCKWLPALIVVPVWWLLNFERKKLWSSLIQLLIIFVIVIVLVLPWQLYIFHFFPTEAAWESQYNLLHFITALGIHGETWYFYLLHASINWNELIWVAFAWFVAVAVRKKFPKEFLALICWIVIPYIFFSVAKTRMEGFVLFTSPAMFIILAYSWFDWKEKMKTAKNWRIPIGILLTAILVLAFRYSIQRIKPFRLDQGKASAIKSIKILPSKISKPNTVFFNTPYYIEVMFYTPFIAYPQIPTGEEVKTVEEQGFNVIIIDDGKIPPAFSNDAKVRVMNL